jgi:hypothetical protein
MTHPQKDSNESGRQLQSALDHASRLAEPGRRRTYTEAWSAQAAQVGDLSVLLLALRS